MYTYEIQQNHKRYLDTLKQEFIQNYATAFTYDKSVEDFDIIKLLGCGTYGVVFLVRDKNTLSYHALKAIEKAEAVHRKTVKQLLQEKKILQSVHFPFLLSLDYCCIDNVYLYLLMPFESGGEVFSLTKKLGVLSESLAQFYAAQVILALEYLHHCSVIHRDVKPENILICESGYIKLGDFGFCKVIKNRTWTLCGTPEYLAPEIIMSKGYSYAADWWSLGVLIFEMNAGHPPFFNTNPMKLYEKILAGEFRTPATVKPFCKSLIKNLLQVDVTKRLGSLKAGVFDIKCHAWFNDIDWSSILHQKIHPSYIPDNRGSGDASNFTDRDDVKLKKCKECLFKTEFADF